LVRFSEISESTQFLLFMSLSFSKSLDTHEHALSYIETLEYSRTIQWAMIPLYMFARSHRAKVLIQCMIGKSEHRSLLYTGEIEKLFTKSTNFDEVRRLTEAVEKHKLFGEGVIKHCTVLLDSPKEMNRENAISILKSAGGRAKSALPKLKSVMENDEEQYIRRLAKEAIDTISPDR
jgi:hypothetical protein